MKKRLLAMAMTLTMVLSLLPTAAWAAGTGTGDFTVTGDTSNYSFGEENGVLTIKGDVTVQNTDPDTSTDNVIVIEGGSEDAPIEVTLAGVNISNSDMNGTAPIAVKSDSYVAITLSGENVLTVSGNGTGVALNVPLGATLTIKGNGELDVSAIYGAGIGGNGTLLGYYGKAEACGTVLIESGTINVNSEHAAAIGGGCLNMNEDSTCNGGNITISGGTVTATGALGIGGGVEGVKEDFSINNPVSSSISISGGTVTATATSSRTPAIGGKGGTSLNLTITISGGTVNATTESTAAGIAAIGSAGELRELKIEISDNSEVTATAAGRMGEAIGGGAEKSATVTISDSASVTASAQSGAAIGGDGAMTLNIDGGTVVAMSNSGCAIGGKENTIDIDGGKIFADSQKTAIDGTKLTIDNAHLVTSGISEGITDNLGGVVLSGLGIDKSTFDSMGLSGNTVTGLSGITVEEGNTTARIIVGSDMTLNDGVTVTVESGASLKMDVDGTFNGTITNSGTIENIGTNAFTLSGGTQLTTGQVAIGSMVIQPGEDTTAPTVNEDGTVTIPAGNTIAGTSVAIPSSVASITVQPDAVTDVKVENGAITLPEGSAFTKAGADAETVYVPAGGTVGNDGDVETTGGTVTVSANGGTATIEYLDSVDLTVTSPKRNGTTSPLSIDAETGTVTVVYAGESQNATIQDNKTGDKGVMVYAGTISATGEVLADAGDYIAWRNSANIEMWLTNNKHTTADNPYISFTPPADNTSVTLTDSGVQVPAGSTVTVDGQASVTVPNGGTVSSDGSIAHNSSGSSSGGSPGVTRYNVTVEDTDNGSVRVSPTRASRGQTVTITVDPDDGYELDRLTVRDSDGDRIDLECKSDTRYTFEMPRGKVTVEAIFTEIEPEPMDLPFSDVPEDHWAYDAIRYVYGEDLMAGTGEVTFSPNGTTTRGQIVTILWRLAGSPQVDYLMDFSDVDPAAWYGEAVRWASSLRIASGYGDGRFGPDDPITREQLAVMLYQYAWNMGYDLAGGGMALREFADYEAISPYALEALDWAVNAGIISGTGDSALSPQGRATRAQTAVMLQKFCELDK